MINMPRNLKSERVGYSATGLVLYRVKPGHAGRCSQCGELLMAPDLFTRGYRSVPICRKCQPFDVDEKESERLFVAR